MSTHTDQLGNARHTAGSTGGIGGQFAAKNHSAPTDTLSDLVVETPKRSSALTTEAIRESQQIMERTASQIVRSYRISSDTVDDIVQDSWVHLLERDGRHGDFDERATERKFLNLTARTLATRYGNDARFGLRSEDFAARRQLRAEQAQFSAANGRKMSPLETEALAGKIRMEFPAGARPKPDFFREISQISLDVPVSSVNGNATTLGDTIEQDDALAFDDLEDEAAIALHAVENRIATKDDVRKDMWRIMSLRFDGAPQTVSGSLDARAVTNYRRLVNKSGGVHKVALNWLDGMASSEQEAALFAPFGDIDSRQRQLVVDVLDANPQFADRIWQSGLAAASQ